MSFTIEIHDKARTRQAWVGRYVSARAALRHNLAGEFTLTVDDDHPRIGLLATPGTRLLVRYEGELIFTGPISSWKGAAPLGTQEFTATDDFAELSKLLAWPVPGNALTNQNVEYHRVTAAAETAIKTVVQANVTRANRGWTVAPSQGRGASITLLNRFHPITERCIPPLDAAGLGATLRQSGASLVFDVYQGATFPLPLSVASGTLLEYTYSASTPDCTHVIVGGQGEGVARAFASVSDASRATLYGAAREVFVDARQTETAQDLLDSGAEALADGAAKSGLSLTLAEAGIFRYGGLSGVHVGDTVTVNLGAATVTDILREVIIDDTPDDGVVVTPRLGGWDDSADAALARSVAAITRDVNSTMRR